MQALMTAPPETANLLRQNMKPVGIVAAERVDQWITDLDSTQFAVRNKASRELGNVLGQAEPALRKRLEGVPSPEGRARVERLLQKLEQEPSREQLQGLRAIEVLEHLATSEARAILRTLASGAATARLTQEAKSSIGRLK
jgi:hypothetical protein